MTAKKARMTPKESKKKKIPYPRSPESVLVSLCSNPVPFPPFFSDSFDILD